MLMQMQLRYMISEETTGKVIAGFMDADEAMIFCNLQLGVMRITIAAGQEVGRAQAVTHTTDTEHHDAKSLNLWAQRIWGQG